MRYRFVSNHNVTLEPEGSGDYRFTVDGQPHEIVHSAGIIEANLRQGIIEPIPTEPEYKPLHELFPLAEGTVLESDTFNPAPFTYRNGNFYKRDCAQPFLENLFSYKWRIVSTPPKRVTFEITADPELANSFNWLGVIRQIRDGLFGSDTGNPDTEDATLRVTVEEVQK